MSVTALVASRLSQGSPPLGLPVGATTLLLYRNDVTLRNHFRLGLSEPLKDELARADLPQSLNDTIQPAMTIDRRLRERQAKGSSISTAPVLTPQELTLPHFEEKIMTLGPCNDPAVATVCN